MISRYDKENRSARVGNNRTSARRNDGVNDDMTVLVLNVKKRGQKEKTDGRCRINPAR
jgi:hypothetical protein